jgi:hypothetical protein
VHNQAIYTKWFKDTKGFMNQGYAFEGRLEGKGIKVDLKNYWITIGYFVNGFPRGEYTQIDNLGNIFNKER